MSSILIMIISSFFFSGCILEDTSDLIIEEEKGVSSLLDSSGSSHDRDDSSSITSSSLSLTSSSIKIKNFNQLNMSFSKATGISRGESDIVNTMKLILNQLPVEHELDSFSAFQQISIIRLAFSYCNLYIDESSDFKKLMESFSDTSIFRESIVDFLIVNLLSAPPEKEPQLYDVLRKELLSVLNNKTGLKDIENFIDSNNKNSLQIKLTKMSCALVLSSPFMTMF